MGLEQLWGGIGEHSDRVAITTGRHVTITAASLTRALAATVDSLEEPRVPNPRGSGCTTSPLLRQYFTDVQG